MDNQERPVINMEEDQSVLEGSEKIIQNSNKHFLSTPTTDIKWSGSSLRDDYLAVDLSGLSPISEEGESEFSDDHFLVDEGNKDVDLEASTTEDDLRSLDGMVNFRISEILPSGMDPLDNSKNCQNGKDELRIDENPEIVPDHNHQSRNPDDNCTDAQMQAVVHDVNLGYYIFVDLH